MLSIYPNCRAVCRAIAVGGMNKLELLAEIQKLFLEAGKRSCSFIGGAKDTGPTIRFSLSAHMPQL